MQGTGNSVPTPALAFQLPVAFRLQAAAFFLDLLVRLGLPCLALGIELLVRFRLQAAGFFREPVFGLGLPCPALGFEPLIGLRLGPIELLGDFFQGPGRNGVALLLSVRLGFNLGGNLRQALCASH